MQKITLIIIFLISSILNAQDEVFIHLNEENSLPDSQFYDILEDDEGIIWLAADSGLYRYDGYSYTGINHPQQVGMAVFNLRKGQDNVVWYTNLANQLFYIKNNKPEFFGDFNTYLKGSLPFLQILKNSIVVSSSTTILIVDKNSKEILHKKDLSMHAYPVYFNKHLYYIQSINEPNKSSTERIIKLDPVSFQEKIVFSKKNKNPIHGESYPVIFNNKLLVYNETVSDKYFFSIDANDVITSINHNIPQYRIIRAKATNSELHLCTERGFYTCKLKNDSLLVHKEELKQEFITETIVDSNQNLWLTTHNNGVFVRPSSSIKSIPLSLSKGDKLKHLYKGKQGNLFYTTVKYDLVELVNNKTPKKIKLHVDKDIRSFYYNEFNDLYYIQFDQKGTYCYNPYFNFLNSNSNIPVIKDIFPLEKSLVAISSNIDFRIIDLKNSLKNHKFKEANRSYTNLHNSHNKLIYFGSINGLFSLTTNYKKTEILYKNYKLYIKDLVELPNGLTAALSFKNGLYFIKDNEVVQHYSTTNGLLSNTNKFIRYFNNHLWIIGNKGIQKLNLETQQIENITKKNGLTSYEFTGAEISNNKLYISSTNQIYYFDNFTSSSNKILQPYFKSVVVQDQIMDTEQDFIELNYLDDKLNVSFNTNGLLTKENITYRYRIAEIDKDWQYTQLGENSVKYNSLPVGTFTFELQALDNNNQSKIQKLKFKKSQAYYKTWWFYTLIAFLLVSSISAWFFSREKAREKEQKAALERKTLDLQNVQLKLESLRSQMNPHFIFNALNSIQDFIIQNEQKLARRYLVKFSELIRIYLEHSQVDKISISEEIEALNLFLELEKQRFEKAFSYTITIKDNLDKSLHKIPTFLIQPYIENAINHGLMHKEEDRNLNVIFKLNNTKTYILCTIIDNGVGRKESQRINSQKTFKHKSFSTMANEKRKVLLNKSYNLPVVIKIIDNFDEERPIGTTVEIQLPVE